MDTTNLLHDDSRYLLNVYKRMSLVVEKADGCYLIDRDGRRYLDMVGGIAVNGLGYADPEIRAAISGQLENYIHLSNFFVSPAVVGLARLLVEHTFAGKVFFTNSGTEAVEAALKLVRKYGNAKSETKTDVVAFHDSFHGRTYGGMSLTGRAKYREPFAPAVPGIKHVRLNDLGDLRNAVSADTCAVFIEMIQGESGVRPLNQAFVTEIIRLAAEHDVLIVADEIQTGLGRTGRLFAHEHFGLVPDLMTVGKSLGGGLPLGALLVSGRLENVLAPGEHGSTFGGNPVACAAGSVVLRRVADSEFLATVRYKEQLVRRGIDRLRQQYPHI
ncbi:MAG TPA: acetylornithine transaminase, partial [Bacillota bacterium]|nr:acetylornithine transaminase [Bacillota bacterium]